MRVKHLCGALALLIIVDSFHGARCQNQPKLALDSTKPFVYVKFDHSGPRSPQRSDEPSQGLWRTWAAMVEFHVDKRLRAVQRQLWLILTSRPMKRIDDDEKSESTA